jgi:thioesterase domain-containing protein
VPLVAVFWSQAVDAVSPELADDTRLMLSALAGADIGIDHETLAALPPRERLAAIVDGAAATGALDPAVTDLEQAERMLRIFRANATALRGHTHEPYDGDLVLLRPGEDEENPFGPAHGWDAVVTGKLDVVTVPGSRYDTAEEPHVRGTATVLREVLDRVDGSH